MPTKVKELILRPGGTYTVRNSNAIGRAVINHKNKEARIINEGDVMVNPKPIRFESWQDFIDTPDPRVVEPKAVSPWSFATGDNASIYVASEEEQSAQSRLPLPPVYAEAQANRDMVLDHAFSDNAAAPASQQDNRAISTTMMLVLAFVSVVAVIIFGAITLSQTL